MEMVESLLWIIAWFSAQDITQDTLIILQTGAYMLTNTSVWPPLCYKAQYTVFSYCMYNVLALYPVPHKAIIVQYFLIFVIFLVYWGWYLSEWHYIAFPVFVVWLCSVMRTAVWEAMDIVLLSYVNGAHSQMKCTQWEFGVYHSQLWGQGLPAFVKWLFY